MGTMESGKIRLEIWPEPDSAELAGCRT